VRRVKKVEKCDVTRYGIYERTLMKSTEQKDSTARETSISFLVLHSKFSGWRELNSLFSPLGPTPKQIGLCVCGESGGVELFP